MMSTIFLYLTVAVLIPLLANCINPPPLPHTGVRLYGGYNNISYPNNSMIPANHFYRDDPNNDGLNDGLWCQSARNEPNIGVWYYPNGSQVSTVDYESSKLHSVHMSGQIGLYRDYGLGNLEGIYKCVIPDEYNINQTLMIALYKEYTYKNNRGPKIIETTFKSLLSTRDQSSFLISFNVTDGTATYINCTLNDTLIYPNITQIILSYQLPTKILVELLFQSRDEGWYNCSVSNTRVEDEYYKYTDQAYPAHNNIYVKIAKKPINVTAKWISSSDVVITWSPPVNNNALINGYEVFYGVCDCKTFSVGVVVYTEWIIRGLCSSLNYIFCVVSYSNEEHTLPSEWSDLATLIEDNEIKISSTLTSSTSMSYDMSDAGATSSLNVRKLSSTLTSVNVMTSSVKPSSQSSDCNAKELLPSLPIIIGSGFLLFTNLITAIAFIMSCLCLQRSRKKRKLKFVDIMIPRWEHAQQFVTSRDGTTVETELNDVTPRLRDNTNEEEYMNPYATHVYALVNKKENDSVSKPEQSQEDIEPPIYANLIAEVKTDDRMTVQVSESDYVNLKKE